MEHFINLFAEYYANYIWYKTPCILYMILPELCIAYLKETQATFLILNYTSSVNMSMYFTKKLVSHWGRTIFALVN